MYSNIHKKLSQKYEEKRRRAQISLEGRRREIHSAIPGIAGIDAEIQQLGIRMGKLIIESSGNPDCKKEVESIKSSISGLKETKKELLLKSGYPGNYLDTIYECPVCSDTGLIYGKNGSAPCSCYRQSVIDELYKNSNIDTKGEYSFENFNYDYYADYIDEKRYGISITPREYMKSVVESCRKFVDDFNNDSMKNILFRGTAGVGKTFLCGCIANSLILKGIPVLYLSSTSYLVIWSEVLRPFENHSDKNLSYVARDAFLLLTDLFSASSIISKVNL